MAAVTTMPTFAALAAVIVERDFDIGHGWTTLGSARVHVQKTANACYIAKMTASEVITVPFSRLTLHYREIGIHRSRRWGFGTVFGFRTLKDLPFVSLASKVKQAYEGKNVPAHEGWPAQREALKWLVDKGRDGIYALEAKGIKIKHTPFRSYYLTEGNHRALALFVLGDVEIQARIKR